MSRIEVMIRELCPNGVPHRPLGEIAELVRGSGMPKSDFTTSGVGVIHYGQIYTRFGVWTDEVVAHVSPERAAKLVVVEPGDVIVASTSENLEDVGKSVAWVGAGSIRTGGHATVVKHAQNPKFLSYWLHSRSFHDQKRQYARGTKVIDLSAKDLAKILVPVPPLELQQEIVKILDQFTRLEAELEAELEARRTQYEYYRDKLLTFEELR